ncbi:hypothetical protein Pen02_74880 [Plantactinospora endophytica]|uniref:Uncharacterized protein n=1 Tax=Plantactinospora endophytica TaxID=673535 RepID=A0ABQ4EE79_9ACTN|nr:hypothetical protein Pen02_74880 [Plantactinospora endophytica]
MRIREVRRHCRAWWLRWLFCRCGRRWRCPALTRSASVPPDRAAFRAGVRHFQTEAAIVRTAATARQAQPAPGNNQANRYYGWNGPTWARPAFDAGRPGDLTPAQRHRARHAERV